MFDTIQDLIRIADLERKTERTDAEHARLMELKKMFVQPALKKHFQGPVDIPEVSETATGDTR